MTIPPTDSPRLMLGDLIAGSGKSRAAVARALQVSPSHVTRLCNSEFVLDIRHAPLLADFLNLPISVVVRAAVNTAAPRNQE